ncbi:MAG: 4-hydroxy-tetrahydrodipicolinate reductase [Candidatus Brocadia sp. AMX2]|uniref:4-hydroxy-tetrahydrodipicolinate reductase n=1 Tax=Candidatus Brocadia sinica JPN1 TaxID=1197129 RepID=A0ABQ0K1N9_9BACT|nr:MULTISPECIES: 4-hydroxy-tetrahydrodipicolinate reductase [Brocadia]MBC6933492.1 4-hydroxy-tetrahydrodipicolinate reductase [Candidatus Brocadia sp.]MBL1170283.1 4-hydroxy-tetrahydrodipicolinate reductase [Candidatus Brocadia sp. AMX1]NOG42497.1 4-hydroxy-tetrahydrodipicolinate reductase [Planctomycetota bacterium]GIK11726.1 MAG: 4-hydroxy-tetrahydrodipicolinate reductase [Candidatus Brocadia sinica]KAA0242354.1 MAG: 4-hydroxy-tetrahydrodipicolinate reductase [Candidatus Brocadia sp. AMX2]
MIEIAINGACGRMGSRIAALVFEDSELKLVAALERPGHQSLGKDVGLVAGCGDTGIIITTAFNAHADVLIDFSSPESAIAIGEICAKKNVAVVVGATGLNPQQHEKMQHFSRLIPCLVSPNMSVGVNVLFNLVAQVAKMVGKEFDIEIIETHHRFKKDSPSGTALRLAEKVCEATGRKMDEDVVYGRSGITGERPLNEIGIHAVRSGDVIGDHTVIFGSLGERIEITHRAHTRDTFVRGAIRAAKFIAKKPPGMYSMSDVLQIQP